LGNGSLHVFHNSTGRRRGCDWW